MSLSVSKKQLDVLDEAKVKSAQDFKIKVEKDRRRAEGRLEREMEVADREGDQHERNLVEARHVSRAWDKAMCEFRPDSPVPHKLKKEEQKKRTGQLLQLVERWGVDDAQKLVTSAVRYWTQITLKFKSAPTHPLLAFLLACDTTFMDKLSVLEDYEKMKEACDKFVRGRKKHDHSFPPDEILKPYRRAKKAMKKAGLLE